MFGLTTITDVAHIIQLAVAPVFLLAGIAGILNVVAHRLARVVDRVRTIELHIPEADEEAKRMELDELAILERRMRTCHLSVGFATAAALLISLVVIILFVATLTRVDIGVPVSVLFILAMTCLTLSLTLFLVEVTVATRFVRVKEEFRRRRLDR